jgi:hypothetical protein
LGDESWSRFWVGYDVGFWILGFSVCRFGVWLVAEEVEKMGDCGEELMR